MLEHSSLGLSGSTILGAGGAVDYGKARVRRGSLKDGFVDCVKRLSEMPRLLSDHR